MKLYDVSLPITNSLPVWPGDPEVSLIMRSSIARGDICNITVMQMGAHTGTHIDAPYHFIDDGRRLDSIPVETFVGPCLVVETDAADIVGRKDIERYNPEGYSRILIKTRNSRLWAENDKSFHADYVSLGLDAARYLVEINICLVGIDYLSIEAYKADEHPVHKLLLENNIAILEGLNLYGIQPGAYEVICMPLKLENCEGAPARAVLREIS